MKLSKLKLENFRLFQELELEIPDSNLIVLVGSNGSGKTSILDAIALCFKHFTDYLLSKSGDFRIESRFKKDDITYGTNKGKVIINFTLNNMFLSDKPSEKSISVIKGLRLQEFIPTPTNFLHTIKNKLNNENLNSIPIIVYYNVNRTYPKISENKFNKSLHSGKLIAYERALSPDSPSFATFEEWFIKQENSENARKVAKKDLNLELPSLKNVRQAFNKFMDTIEPDTFCNLSVSRESRIGTDFSEEIKEFLSISKNDIPLKFSQLSYGERMVISLVCEIARRLTIANDNAENSLSGQGIVLIDELDLHLHPTWQRSISYALKKAFPNIQFIFSSHSPLILSGLKRENILILNNGEVIPNNELPDIYSGTADEILVRMSK